MREREQKWRQKTQAEGRKQIACWLDGDTYQFLRTLIQEHQLRGMGEAIRLLVDRHQGAQEAPQAVDGCGPEQPQETAQAPEQDVPALLERQPDTQRCECRTASGGRCRNKATAIIKARVGDQIGEFGSCKRHSRHFEPYSVD